MFHLPYIDTPRPAPSPSSSQINRRPAEYWGRVMEVARLNNLSRVQRCGQIMGRAEAGEMSSAQIFYPCMQVRGMGPRSGVLDLHSSAHSLGCWLAGWLAGLRCLPT